MDSADTAPGRARAEHLGPERRRPMILDAAYDVFLERGYDRTSMSDIALRAGVTKPVVYDCFASKEALFAAVRDKLEQQLLADVGVALESARAADDSERTAVAGFTAFLESVERSPNAFRYIYLPVHGIDTATEDRVGSLRESGLKAFESVALPVLRAQGVERPEENARLVAYAISGLGEAAARALLTEPDRWTPAELGERLGRLLIRGATAL
jgi:AcrR family transcriptional regulator